MHLPNFNFQNKGKLHLEGRKLVLQILQLMYETTIYKKIVHI